MPLITSIYNNLNRLTYKKAEDDCVDHDCEIGCQEGDGDDRNSCDQEATVVDEEGRDAPVLVGICHFIADPAENDPSCGQMW